MVVKYKIHELAKDFNISSKDVIALISEKLGVEKKSQTSLEENELDLVFECILAEHQVKSFDEYFAMGAENREKAKKAREEKTTSPSF